MPYWGYPSSSVPGSYSHNNTSKLAPSKLTLSTNIRFKMIFYYLPSREAGEAAFSWRAQAAAAPEAPEVAKPHIPHAGSFT